MKAMMQDAISPAKRNVPLAQLGGLIALRGKVRHDRDR
jgi:hypothetical protein